MKSRSDQVEHSELERMDLEEAVHQVMRNVYEATAIFEELESFKKIVGNAHHIRQRAAEMMGKVMRERWRERK